MRFAEYCLLKESKQEIINLGYPEIIAKLFYKRHGNLGFLFSRWYKEYWQAGRKGEDKFSKNWFYNHSIANNNIYYLITLYNATSNREKYIETLKKLDIESEDPETYDEYYLNDQRKQLENDIEKDFFGKSSLFSNHLVNRFYLMRDILSGKLKNIKPYKNLNFYEADKKYTEKQLFEEKEPLLKFNDGFKWINVGRSCDIVGDLMKNCGSAGVMGDDKDRVIIALFDQENKPHVVVTYSPNQRRISGDEGVASTAVKDKYHEYILRLAEFLNVEFDADKTKSKFLFLKYRLKGKGENLKKLVSKRFSKNDEYFEFYLDDKKYYTDGHNMIASDDLLKIADLIKRKEFKPTYYYGRSLPSMIKTVFSLWNFEDSLKRQGINDIQMPFINHIFKNK